MWSKTIPTEMPPLTYIELIPIELVFEILSYLSLQDRKYFSLCSKTCRNKALPTFFHYLKLKLYPTELSDLFSSLRNEDRLAHIRHVVKRVTLQPSIGSINEMIEGYQIFANGLYLFSSLSTLLIGLNTPIKIVKEYPSFDHRLFHAIFRKLAGGSSAYYTIKQVHLTIRTIPPDIGLRPLECGLEQLGKKSREFLGLPLIPDGSAAEPLTDNYFPPNLEELYFDYDRQQLITGRLYPLSSILTTKTLKKVCLNVIQAFGRRNDGDYGFPDDQFPNVKVLRIHSHFLCDGAKDFFPLLKLFPNVEDFAVYLPDRMCAIERVVYQHTYDVVSLFPKVRNIRMFWMRDDDYSQVFEFMASWELASIVKRWLVYAKALETVVFARDSRWWRPSVKGDKHGAIEVRIEWKEESYKLHWSGFYMTESLEFDGS